MCFIVMYVLCKGDKNRDIKKSTNFKGNTRRFSGWIPFLTIFNIVQFT